MALLYRVKYSFIKGFRISKGENVNSVWLFLSGQAGLRVCLGSFSVSPESLTLLVTS